MITDEEYLTRLQAGHKWPGLQAIGMVEAERRLGTERSAETRYCVLSRALTAQALGEALRSH